MFEIHERHMQSALAEARAAAAQGEIPIGAVIVAGGHIIARAHNLTETLGDVTAHAEMQALTAAAAALGGKYLDKCTLYVTVEPCPMCAAALRWAQLGTLVYGTPDTKRGYTTVSKELLHPKTTVIASVMEQECSRLMSDFFTSLRSSKS